MRKTFTLLAAVAALSAMFAMPSHAVTLDGKWGPGYFRPEAPLGIRWWLNEKLGLDGAIGFTSDDASGDRRTDFRFDAGVPIVLAGMGDNTKFFVRPGLRYASTPAPTGLEPDNKQTSLGLTGTLGVEHFFTDRFSVQVATGVIIDSVDPDAAGDSHTTFASEDFGISSIGFHYYFGGK
jgi:hypothetical protein